MSRYEENTPEELQDLLKDEIAEIMERNMDKAKEMFDGKSKQERMELLEAQIAESSGTHAAREGDFTKLIEMIGQDMATGMLADDAMRKIAEAGPERCFNNLNVHQKIICASIVNYVIYDALRSAAIAHLKEHKRELFGQGESE